MNLSFNSMTPLPAPSPLSSHCQYCTLCTCLPPNNDLSVLSWLNTWLYRGQQQYTSKPHHSQWIGEEEGEEENSTQVYYDDSDQKMNNSIDMTLS